MRPVASSGACDACPDNRGRPRTATDRLVKRISFNEQHAEHIYEWLRTYWRGAPKKFGGCVECAHIGRRLKRRIGPAAVRRTARLVHNNPGDDTGVARTKKKHAQSGKG
jgi:hypothetical protein